MQWHNRFVPIVDTHADSLLSVVNGDRHLTRRSEQGQLDFPRLQQVGSTLQFLSCWVEPQFKPERALTRQLAFLDAFWQEMDQNPGVIAVTDTDSLNAVVQTQSTGVALSIEGAEAVGTDPAVVRLLYRLGVRLMSLTWNERNALADGAGEDPGGYGLSRAGRRIIAEMNRLKMVVDVSHLAHQGFWDVLETSTRPVIASHSNCRALCDHKRNLTDGQVRALAAQGGVQGIAFVRDFLGGAEDLNRVVDHMAYAMDLVGSDKHIGLGSDFDGVDRPVLGLEDVTCLPHLADRMSARNFSDETIARIFGENYLAFYRQAWT
ncbi:MAG: dipeptidase [Firmicutes bacterium]|nr:dipeptidase [Bacillota bacterium]